MGYITEIGLNSRFFQGKGAYQLVYHKNSGTLPLKGFFAQTWTAFSLAPMNEEFRSLFYNN